MLLSNIVIIVVIVHLKALINELILGEGPHSGKMRVVHTKGKEFNPNW